MNTDVANITARAWNWLIGKHQPRHHWRRYIFAGVCSVAAIAGLAICYLVFLPRTYTSEWSIILPGAGVEARVSVERLGQAQSSARSPFSARELSPRVNYKEIAASRPVIAAAAKSIGETVSSFGMPKLKLIDQTSIIEFKISARTPQQAQRKAWALHQALKTRLDLLRADEIKWRNNAIRDSIGSVEKNLSRARERLLALQQSSGLATIEQYNQLIGSIETLRRSLVEAKTKLAETSAAVKSLSDRIGFGADTARDLMLLGADPEFRHLWQAYATASATYAENASRLGSEHPRVLEANSKKKSVANELQVYLVKRNVKNLPLVSSALVSASHDRIVVLFSEFLNRHAEMAGLRSRVEEVSRQIENAEVRRKKLGVVAARLDDLERDHKIANAVFGSALARIDASRSDIYASYPLLQILQEPSLPEQPSSPRPVFAIAGAVLGSLLAITGWTFAWLHQWFAFIRLTRRSYSPR